MNKDERVMYEVLKPKLKGWGYEVKLSDETISDNKDYLKKVLGQITLRPDIVACRNKDVWIIECKNACAIGQLGFALGQIIATKCALEDERILAEFKTKIRVDVIESIKFSIALLITKTHPLNEQEQIYESMLEDVDFPVDSMTIDKNRDVKIVIPASAIVP